jgi:DNA replication protein DnaC
METMTRLEKTVAMSALVEAPNATEIQDRRDFDAAGKAYVATALRKAAEERFWWQCPIEYRESDWNRLGQFKTQINQVLSWKSGGKGLLLSGPTGRGKTRAMWGLIRRLAIEEGKDVRYWHASEWFATLQAQANYGRDDARGWVDAVAKHPFLFIDDLGQEAVSTAKSAWAEAWFFRFLDLRVGAGLPLFVTTNLSSKQMAEQETDVRGDPLVRRLLDLCEVVKF